MGESLRRRELTRTASLVTAGDLDAATLNAERLVALYPLDAEVRRQAAEVARALGDPQLAGAHLFMTAGARDRDGPALAEFEELLVRDPLAAFYLLGLRDVPAPEALAPEPGSRLSLLLGELEQRDYPRLRLGAILYARRRSLRPWERRYALGCLALFALACTGVAVLAALGLAHLR